MTKPLKGPPKVQVTAYVRDDIKRRLAERALADGRPERDVLEEALDEYLAKPAVSAEPPPPDPA